MKRQDTRGIIVKSDDPGVLSAGVWRPRRVKRAYLLRTADLGETRKVLPLPTQPNATIWGLATHPANARRIVAFSLFGEMYVGKNARGF